MPLLPRYAVALLLREKRLLVRFGLTSAGCTALLMSAILLIKEFLGGVLGDPAGLPGALAAAVGIRAALWIVAALLLGAFVGAALLTYDNKVTQQRLIRSIEAGVTERLVRHLLTLSVGFYERQSQGDLIETVRQDVAHLRLVAVAAAEMVLYGMTAAGLLATATYMSPQLAATALSITAVAAVPVLLTARKLRRRSFGLRRKGYLLFDSILQMLRGIRIIKIYQGEESEAKQATERTRRYFEELIRITRITAMGNVALESLAGLGIVIITIVGGFQVMDGRLEWPGLLAFLMAVRGAHGPLHHLNSSYLSIQRHSASLHRIDELLATRPAVVDPPQPAPLTEFASLRFDSVDFAYERGGVVLHDVSFDLPCGEVLGVVGPSGAGKTTLLNLVARFYDPTSGQIRLNDRDIRSYRAADVHRLIGIVTQDPFLFAATVRDNIRCGRPGSSDRDVEAAARAADIHEEILRLPRGYDTMVGVGAQGLSGGQVQRINIARAILKNAPLLILDEATSSLDSIAESKVQKALGTLMRGRTTLMVAHRLSTLRSASRILVLDRGALVAAGDHEELLVRSAVYRQMWETQTLKRPQPATQVDQAVERERQA